MISRQSEQIGFTGHVTANLYCSDMTLKDKQYLSFIPMGDQRAQAIFGEQTKPNDGLKK